MEHLFALISGFGPWNWFFLVIMLVINYVGLNLIFGAVENGQTFE